MKVGITGTRHGITAAQQARLHELTSTAQATELHHGDCQGADAAAHFGVLNMRSWRMFTGLPRIRLVAHPADDSEWRAFCQGYDELREPLPYLDRNHALVDAVDLLLALPRTAAEERRSGTWAAVRYARQAGTPVIIIEPGGAWRLDGSRP